MTAARRAATDAGSGWIGTLAGLCGVIVLTFTAFGAVIPVLPPLVLDELGGGPFEVGVVFAVSGFVAILGRPYAGRAAQRWGSRRVMAAGCGLAALVGAAYALPYGLPGLYAARLLLGVAESAVFTAGSVWVVALAPESRRGQLVGYYGLAMWSGFTLGPLVGSGLLAAYGYAAVWWFAALAPVAAAAVLSRLPASAAAGGATSRRVVPRAALLPGLALALGGFGYAALIGFVVLHLAARDVAGGGAMLSLFGAAYVTVRLVAGRLPDRLGARRVAMVCGLVEAAGLLLITVAGNWWLAALGAVVMGAGFTLLYPALALLVIDGSPAAERGAAIGAYTSFWDLGLGVAGLVAGAVAAVSYPAVFALAAALAVAAGLVGTRAGAAPRAQPAAQRAEQG